MELFLWIHWINPDHPQLLLDLLLWTWEAPAPKSTLCARDQCKRARWRKHTRASSVLNILVIERNKQRTERKTVRRGLVIVTVDLFAPGHPQSSTCLGSHNAQLLIKAHSYLLLTTWYWDCHSFCQNVKMPRVPFLSTFILESTNMPGLGKTCHF